MGGKLGFDVECVVWQRTLSPLKEKQPKHVPGSGGTILFILQSYWAANTCSMIICMVYKSVMLVSIDLCFSV